MKKENRNWKVYFYLILIGILVSSCSRLASIPKESHIGGVWGGVDAHAYTSVIEKSELDKLEHMVTYVLFTETPKDDKTKRQYLILLKSIMHNKIDLDNNRYDKELLSQINRFIIPTHNHIRRGEDHHQTLNNYNFSLSNDILNELRKRYELKKFKSSGPYLITTRDNLFQDKDLHALYVNLNRFDKVAIHEVIKIYKKRLEVEDNIEADFSLIDRLTLNVMAFIVPANEHIEGIANVIIKLGATPIKKDKK
jgi:hypothetical protein